MLLIDFYKRALSKLFVEFITTICDIIIRCLFSNFVKDYFFFLLFYVDDFLLIILNVFVFLIAAFED